MSAYMDTPHYRVNKFAATLRVLDTAAGKARPYIYRVNDIPLTLDDLEAVVRQAAASNDYSAALAKIVERDHVRRKNLAATGKWERVWMCDLCGGETERDVVPKTGEWVPSIAGLIAHDPDCLLSPQRALGNPQTLVQHIEWLHTCLREAGHCIDGGRCHHNCEKDGPCFRENGCAPLTGSRLDDNWRLPGQPAGLA